MASDDLTATRRRSAVLRPLVVRRKVVRRRRASSLLDRANRYLVGGVDSPVRAFRHVGGRPIVIDRSAGAVVTDVEGRRYLDLIMGWGALILGHNHFRIIEAVKKQVSRGVHFGLTHEGEAALAGAIVEAFPSIEQVRFTASGTEACMTAIRLARAATGRPKLLTFEGCYHGHSDGLLVKRGSGLATLGLSNSAGVPEAIAQETIVVPYNDLDALEEAVRQFGDTMACAIIEPVAANMVVVVAGHAFLHRLRELTRRCGALLIFDEVVTGFRVAYGGAQTRFNIEPDLTVLGKIIGGGFPVGAVGGPKRLMEQLAPEGSVYHAGTFAGHPVAMAAGLAALQELKRHPPYERLEALGYHLAIGLWEAGDRAGVPMQVNQCGSMLTVFFSHVPVTRFADVQRTDRERFAAFAKALRRTGILIPPSPYEAMFLSTVHTRAAVDRIIAAARRAYA